MIATILRGDALHLPLADESVDLIVTSPPYFALRSYQDGGVHFAGQIGSEESPQAWLEALWAATAEMVRVLKPSGSIFVNLGDKYAGSGGGGVGSSDGRTGRGARPPRFDVGIPAKSLMLLPERYRIGAVDRLGLIARAVIIWDKPNGLPESVTDRVRRSHEDWVHLTKQPRYYSAIDEVREAYGLGTAARYRNGYKQDPSDNARIGKGYDWSDGGPSSTNPLGKMPGSVWNIPSEPLQVPPELGVDHFAAYPTEWPRRIIAGWSPPGICVECGQGRRSATTVKKIHGTARRIGSAVGRGGFDDNQRGMNAPGDTRPSSIATITGYVCACTPHTDHPGTGGSNRRADNPYGEPGREQGVYSNKAGEYERVGPVREYHFDRWTPAPTRPAVVLDPFAGTGTTMLVADVLGRHGIGIDLSADYCRLARWRCTDPASRAKAARMEKPPPVIDGQLTLELM